MSRQISGQENLSGGQRKSRRGSTEQDKVAEEEVRRGKKEHDRAAQSRTA